MSRVPVQPFARVVSAPGAGAIVPQQLAYYEHDPATGSFTVSDTRPPVGRRAAVMLDEAGNFTVQPSFDLHGVLRLVRRGDGYIHS